MSELSLAAHTSGTSASHSPRAYERASDGVKAWERSKTRRHFPCAPALNRTHPGVGRTRGTAQIPLPACCILMVERTGSIPQ